LLREEAFDVLGLKSGATLSEIKEAYRDLVKVWHPDRFANDLRLIHKADLQLKLINEAYTTLQSDPVEGGRYIAPSARGDSAALPASRGSYRSSEGGIRFGSVYIGLAIVVIFVAGCFFVANRGMRATGPPDSARQQTDTKASVQGPAGIEPSDKSVGGLPPKAIDRASRSGLRDFTVSSLSAADTERLTNLCSRQKELWGLIAYQDCLKAQLRMIKRSTSKADLTALSVTERESIEAACSDTRRIRGQVSYNRCENEQAASLAAEPARPDLSMLNDRDRFSIESACANTKSQQGPAGYNRCLERFVNALERAK
jgi:curved DNA-binding protein CbpA